MNRPRVLQGRKLLVASLGVAAVNYAVACNQAEVPPSAGNLMPDPSTPVYIPDASAPVATASAVETSPTVDPYMTPPVAGNLMPSPPRDAGTPRHNK